MQKRVLSARVQVAIEFPDTMSVAIAQVLNGEYESGYFGEKLTVLDIGANVGSFALWANMRWSGSTIYAYEPHPETFKILLSNVEELPNVICHNVAVSPSEEKQELFYSRYTGDGEAGLVTYMAKTFEELASEKTFVVSVLHPRDLPKCNVLKIDVEGAEADILESMELKDVSLILLEYQYDENRRRIKEMLGNDFYLEYEDSFQWRAIMPGSKYRKDLRDDYYGRLFFINKQQNRLQKLAAYSVRH